MAAVNWMRGPWATQPYQYLMEQQAQQGAPPQPYGSLLEQEPGGGRGDVGTKGTAESGPLSASEKSTLGGFSRGLGAANMAASIAGFGLPGLGKALIGAKALTGIPSAIADYFGAKRELDAFFGLAPADIQTHRDYYGNIVGDEMAAEAARRSGLMEAGWGPGGPQGGWSGETGPAPSAPKGDPEDPSNLGGMGSPGGGEGPGQGPGGGPSGETGGSYGGFGDVGTGGWLAKGGVRTARRPTRLLIGEGGEPETAIVVPESMKRRGIQGRERQVRRGLKRAYAGLTEKKD